MSKVAAKPNMEPLECFVVDNIPTGLLPIYDVHPANLAVCSENGGARHLMPIIDAALDKPSMRVIVPLECSSPTQETAWEVLLMASHAIPPVRLSILDEYMHSIDLKFEGFVRRDGKILAVSCPEYFGRRAVINNDQGLLVYNPRAVVRVDCTEDELTVYDVMSS